MRLMIVPSYLLKPAAALIVSGIMGLLLLSVFWQGSTVFAARLAEPHIVVLDPGHGGYDPGTITPEGLYEKELNLHIAQKVAALLRPSGIEVILTREEDQDFVPDGVRGKSTRKQIDLNYRIGLANQVQAEIFVSLHVNATVTGRNSGAETFYHSSSAEGIRLAESIQQELIKIPDMNKRVAKPGDFYIINNTAMPAVIVELGYLSNSKEREKLEQTWYQDQLARAVAKGIAVYFGLP